MTVRTFSQQKAALTRVVRSGDAAKVRDECARTVAEWDSIEWAHAHRVRQGAWPDDWARWQRALDDVHCWPHQPRLEEVADTSVSTGCL